MTFISGAGGKGFVNWINLMNEIGEPFICGDMTHTPFHNIILPPGDSIDFLESVKQIKSDQYIFCVDEEIWNLSDKKILPNDKVLNPMGEILNFCDKYNLSQICPYVPKSSLNPLEKFPYIAKKRFSRGSRDLKKIINKHDLENIDHHYFFQEYIGGVDIFFDVLVLENDFIFYYRLSKKKFLNITFHFELGYDEKFYNFVKDVIYVIKKYTSNTKFIVNFDCRIWNDNIYLLEINPRPSFHFPAIVNPYFFKNFLDNKLIKQKKFRKELYGQIIFM